MPLLMEGMGHAGKFFSSIDRRMYVIGNGGMYPWDEKVNVKKQTCVCPKEWVKVHPRGN